MSIRAWLVTAACADRCSPRLPVTRRVARVRPARRSRRSSSATPSGQAATVRAALQVVLPEGLPLQLEQAARSDSSSRRS